MAIVSELPFMLQVIKGLPAKSCQDGTLFMDQEQEVWKKEIVTFQIEENEDIEILFNSEDQNAKLYLEALDIVSLDDRKIAYDLQGRIYRKPDPQPFVLYKQDSGFDALCVDTFQISVFCCEKWHYGALQVLPKQMNLEEWTMMKDELEHEMAGLAQDLIQKNIGFGNGKNDDLPPKILWDFIVIKKYAQAVLASLLDIAENPRSEIATQYKRVINNRDCRMDQESIRRYATRAGSEATYKVPVKVVKYDIQENRILKRILIDYEKRLQVFLELMTEFQNYKRKPALGKWDQYKSVLEKSISESINAAQKLKKITSLIKTKEWYLEVGNVSQTYIPHSFIMDTRYNTLYQMYLEWKRGSMQIAFDPAYSYTWKRSSYLYEMWCYFKMIHLLSEQYEINTPDWTGLLSGKMLFPFLESGTSIGFQGDDVRLQVVFDKPLAFRQKETDINSPLYIAKTQEYSRMHNRPDIIIYVYYAKNGWYLGSIVLECKYRKLYAFLDESGGGRSSRGQLQAYYNNTRTSYQLGELGKKYDLHPVRKVIVLTPDVQGDGKRLDDFNILVKGFKPAHTDDWNQSLLKEISISIKELTEIGDDFYSRR